MRKERVNHAEEACGLCDTVHRSANKGFIMCKKFLQLKPKERCDLVHKKKKCLQCLDGVAKWNDKAHLTVCSQEWVCQNPEHSKYDRKLHFLICEAHAGEDANMTLFERFKKVVLKSDWQKRVFKGMTGYFISSKFLHRKAQKKLRSGVVVEDPDEICADFAAQIHCANVVAAADEVDADCASEEICADFAAQLADGEDDEICMDFAMQIGICSPSSKNVSHAEKLISAPATPLAAASDLHFGPVSPPPLMVEYAVTADIRADMEMVYLEEIPDAKCHGSPVFLLQPVPFNDHVFNFMFDSGCETFVSRRGALDYLPSHCKRNVWPGPVLLHGVGGCAVTPK